MTTVFPQTALVFATLVLVSGAGSALAQDSSFDPSDVKYLFAMSKTSACAKECTYKSNFMERLSLPPGKVGFLITTTDTSFCGSGGCSSIVVVASAKGFKVLKEGLGITKDQAIALILGEADTARLESGRPSFDCAKAMSASARLICSDPELSKADGLLGARFKSIFDSKDHVSQGHLRAEQLTWILNRNNRCGVGRDKANVPVERLAAAKPCMLQAINERIEAITTGMSSMQKVEGAQTGQGYYVANTRPPDAFLSLRSEPSTTVGHRIAQLPNGTALSVLLRRPDQWWRVRVVTTGQEGWALSGQGGSTWIVCCEGDPKDNFSVAPNTAASTDTKQTVMLAQLQAAKLLGDWGLFTCQSNIHEIIFAENDGAIFRKMINRNNGFTTVTKIIDVRSAGPGSITLSSEMQSGANAHNIIDITWKLEGDRRQTIASQDRSGKVYVQNGLSVPSGIKAASFVRCSDASSPNQMTHSTMLAQISAVYKTIREQSNTVTNADRKKQLDRIAVRLSAVTPSMSVAELKSVEKEAEAAVEILDEAADFKKTSKIANERVASVNAALAKLAFDAPLIGEIRKTIGLVEKAQTEVSLQSLKEALTKLALLYPDKLSRLKEAKSQGFDTIEAYDQYQEEKQKLSRSGIRLKSH